MFVTVLPLRAIVFQCLFLLLTIAMEGVVFQRVLKTGYKDSMRYAATINLFSTFVGWVVFFVAQPLLPQALRLQLISYVFFERFLANTWMVRVSPVLVGLSLVIFFGTFLIELQALEILEFLLGRSAVKDTVDVGKIARFQGRKKQAVGLESNSKARAVLLGNACSFAVILVLLLMRLIDQDRGIIQ